MLKCSIGFVIGAIFQTTVIIIGIALKRCKYKKKRDKHYKCKSNAMKICGDQCCHFCLGATDCMWACEQDPGKCDQAIVR